MGEIVKCPTNALDLHPGYDAKLFLLKDNNVVRNFCNEPRNQSMIVKFDNCYMSDFKTAVVGPDSMQVEFKNTVTLRFEELVKVESSKAEILESIGLLGDTPDEAISDALKALFRLKDESTEAQEKAVLGSKLKAYISSAGSISSVLSFLLNVLKS